MTSMLFSVAILLAITAGAIAVSNPAAADQSLMSYMMRSKFSDDPEISAQCFGYYLPVLSGVASNFSKNFQQCLNTEKDTIARLNDKAISDRYQIELAADGVCVRLDACNELPDALAFFDCISGQGSDNSKILYMVTQNSTVKGGELREQYRIIETDKYKCQNASERVYVEDTAKTYKELDLCLQTGDIPSTISPESTTQPTTSSTTIKTEETTTTEVGTTTDTSTTRDTSTTTGRTTELNTSTTESGPQETTTVPPQNEPQEDLTNGRGLKVLTNLRRFWRNNFEK